MSGLEKDHSLYALKEGCVKFETHKFSGRKWVHVEPKKCPLSSLCYCCFRRAEDSHIRENFHLTTVYVKMSVQFPRTSSTCLPKMTKTLSVLVAWDDATLW